MIGPVWPRKASDSGASRSSTSRSTDRKSGFASAAADAWPERQRGHRGGRLDAARKALGQLLGVGAEILDRNRRVVAPVDADGPEQRMLSRTRAVPRAPAPRSSAHRCRRCRPSPGSSRNWCRSARRRAAFRRPRAPRRATCSSAVRVPDAGSGSDSNSDSCPDTRSILFRLGAIRADNRRVIDLSDLGWDAGVGRPGSPNTRARG